MLVPGLTVIPDQQNAYEVQIDGETYLQQVYTVKSGTWVDGLEISIWFDSEDVPDGMKIVNMNNQEIEKIPVESSGYQGQFKVICPKDSITGNTSVKFLLEGNVNQYAAFYAICQETGTYGQLQNYIADTDPVLLGEIATSVGMTPANFSPGVFAMIRNISESVIIPIAGLILTFIACYELIQMIIDHNNLANFETWTFFKWVFKTFVAVMLITNTFNITMAVFDVAQHVVNSSAGIISTDTAVDAAALEAMEETLKAMELGELLGLLLQSFILQVTMYALSIVIFIIVYSRMIEIYLMVSLAPIPFSTFANREQSQIGQNYLRSLFALGFQGFLIIICVGIYAVLIQSVSISGEIIASIWGVMGYTVLLCFTLFKTGSLTKSVFNAH